MSRDDSTQDNIEDIINSNKVASCDCEAENEEEGGNGPSYCFPFSTKIHASEIKDPNCFCHTKEKMRKQINDV